MPSTRSQTRANYDRLSWWYDLLAGSSERALRDLGLREVGVQPGEHVLELGCGTGAALVELARAAGLTGFAVGLDLSLGMCRETQRKLADGPRNTQHVLRNAYSVVVRQPLVLCADATLLPFIGGVFDAVFMSFALELFDESDMRAVLAECRRVLRPSGRLCVVAMGLPDRATPMTRLYAWAGARFPTTVDCRPIAVSQVLALGGFSVEHLSRRPLWGLPVDVALARAGQTATEARA
jgi:demethylmenaquinone methyltransferase/2-methoxy-6-polyprenyl-1,4-benzoquinol methylase